MRNTAFLFNTFIALLLLSTSCLKNNVAVTSDNGLPSFGHDLSYIPYDAKSDNPNFNICDSTKIGSGKNGVRYADGTEQFKKDLISAYFFRKSYESFNGYLVVRFLVNCEGQTGRYRAEALNLDFSPSKAPSDLLESSIELVKRLDNWTRPYQNREIQEFSKYINLKINNGRIQHVLL